MEPILKQEEIDSLLKKEGNPILGPKPPKKIQEEEIYTQQNNSEVSLTQEEIDHLLKSEITSKDDSSSQSPQQTSH